MRVFLDSNTIVSGLLFEGNESTLLELGSMRALELVSSNYVMCEVKRVLARPEFDLTRREREGLIRYLNDCLIVVEDPSGEDMAPYRDLLDDKKDLPVAIGAKAAGADYLVTGDKELLSKKTWLLVKTITTLGLLKMIFEK